MAGTARLTTALAIALAAAFIVGIVAAALPDDDDASVPTSNATTTPAESGPSAPATRQLGQRRERDVARDSFPGKWPLVRGTATITCTPREAPMQHLATATVVVGKKEYRLNGMAVGLPELNAEWLDNEAIPGAKVNIGDLVDAALELCGPAK